MTAPLFHLTPGALDAARIGSQLTLCGSEGHHAATVMRLGAGEEVQLSDTQQTRVLGEITNVTPGAITLQVRQLSTEPIALPRLILVQALAKDRRDQQAVESATELGVDAIIPWQADRSVAKWKTGKEQKKHNEWVNLTRSAAKQTRRTSIPEVRPLHTTAQYLEVITGQPSIGVVVLHETDNKPLRQALNNLGEITELHLVIGPEGGIRASEIEKLSAAGARTARLGRTVLRSSTAGPAAIAATQLILGRWDEV